MMCNIRHKTPGRFCDWLALAGMLAVSSTRPSECNKSQCQQCGCKHFKRRLSFTVPLFKMSHCFSACWACWALLVVRCQLHFPHPPSRLSLCLLFCPLPIKDTADVFFLLLVLYLLSASSWAALLTLSHPDPARLTVSICSSTMLTLWSTLVSQTKNVPVHFALFTLFWCTPLTVTVTSTFCKKGDII